MTMTSSLVHTIMAENADIHQRITAKMEVALFEGFASEARYITVLKRMFGFYTPLEEHFNRWQLLLAGTLNINERRKVPLLQKDLCALGMTAEAQSRMPRCPLPVLDTIPQILGALFVVEGATHGGAMIAQRIDASLGITQVSGGSFFRSYGPRVVTMWNLFSQALNSLSGQDQTTAICTAAEVFSIAEGWLFPSTPVEGNNTECHPCLFVRGAFTLLPHLT